MSDTAKAKKTGWARWVWCDLAVLLIVLYYGATIGVRIWWGSEARSELQVEVRAIEVAGQSLDFNSLVPPPTSDIRNATILYVNALQDSFFSETVRMAEVKGVKPAPQPAKQDADIYLGSLAGDFVDDPAKRKANTQLVREILRKGSAAAALCREARDRPDVVWNDNPSTQPSQDDLPFIRGLAWLSNLMCLFAVDAGDSGKQADAAEYLLDALYLGDAISQMPTFRDLLIACQADENLFKVVEQISPSLTKTAGRDKLEALVKKLAYPTAIQMDFERACMGDRCLINDMISQLRSGFFDKMDDGSQSGPLSVWFLINPVWDLDQARVIRSSNSIVQASCQESFPAAMIIAPPRKSDKDDGGKLMHFTHFMSLQAPNIHVIIFKSYYTRLAQRRLAACTIAWRLFKADTGKDSKTLDDLVKGKYLDDVPRDPFSLQPHPLRLAFVSGKPVIYSIYIDGQDDGGNSDDLPIFPDGRP